MTTTITGLPNATTPLTGTERLPMDQAGATKDATAQDIANLAPPTDLSYNATTRTISSSTGSDVVLTLADTVNPGLLSAAGFSKLASITVDSATLLRKYVYNNSGVPIPKGAAVYETGSSGTTITVALADASTEATASQTLGLAQEAIAHNSNGYVVAVGLIDGISTATLTEGQICWLSETPGQLTTTRPTQPAHGVVCGYCVKQAPGAAGILYVKVDNGLELAELHDVLLTGAITGSVLRLAADGLWKPATLPAAADALPSALGTAAVGVSTDYAREDHVHQLPTIPAAADALPSALGIPAVGVSTDYAREDHAHQMPSAADVGAISSTTVRAANLVLAGPASGSPAPSTFRALVTADLPAVQYAPRVTISAVSSVYTLDAAATNEAVTGSAIAGNTTITASNLTGIPAGQVWRCVLRFAWTSGAITLSAPVGYTAKPPASLPTLVTGRTYKIIAECVGGESTLEWIYGNGDGYTT